MRVEPGERGFAERADDTPAGCIAAHEERDRLHVGHAADQRVRESRGDDLALDQPDPAQQRHRRAGVGTGGRQEMDAFDACRPRRRRERHLLLDRALIEARHEHQIRRALHQALAVLGRGEWGELRRKLRREPCGGPRLQEPEALVARKRCERGCDRAHDASGSSADDKHARFSPIRALVRCVATAAGAGCLGSHISGGRSAEGTVCVGRELDALEDERRDFMPVGHACVGMRVDRREQEREGRGGK